MTANAWARVHSVRLLCLRGTRRIRPGRWHHVSDTAGRGPVLVARRCRRTRMGRKRVVASADRPWALGRISCHVRRIFSRRVPSGDPDAVLLCRSRRKHRDAVERRPVATRLGSGLHGRIADAAFLQGVIFGTLVQGVPLEPDTRFEGGTFDFLSGYTILTGLAVVALYQVAGTAMVKIRSRNASLLGSLHTQGRAALLIAGGLVVLSGAVLPLAGASSITLDQPFRVVVVVWMSVAAVAMFATAWWSFGRSDHTYMPFVAVLIAGLLASSGSLRSFTR